MEKPEDILPSSIESIVFSSQSIKPNPFIVKQPATKHRL